MYYFNLGEIRNVGLEITSRTGDSFEITNASCRVLRDGSSVTTQSATVDGSRILSLFSADAAGRATVEFSYTIGAEKFITPIEVEVRP